MATHQFESAKKLILYFTQKNRMSPESDIKGVMPGEHVSLGPHAPPPGHPSPPPGTGPHPTTCPWCVGSVLPNSSPPANFP